jgi:hypothetical protein
MAGLIASCLATHRTMAAASVQNFKSPSWAGIILGKLCPSGTALFGMIDTGKRYAMLHNGPSLGSTFAIHMDIYPMAQWMSNSFWWCRINFTAKL